MQLRDRQPHVAYPGVPFPGAIAIAPSDPLTTALAVTSATDLVSLAGIIALTNDTIICCNRSGDATPRCCSNNCTGSTLCAAAIVIDPHSSSLDPVLEKITRWPYHITTPRRLPAITPVHHHRGHNHGPPPANTDDHKTNWPNDIAASSPGTDLQDAQDLTHIM